MEDSQQTPSGPSVSNWIIRCLSLFLLVSSVFVLFLFAAAIFSDWLAMRGIAWDIMPAHQVFLWGAYGLASSAMYLFVTGGGAAAQGGRPISKTRYVILFSLRLVALLVNILLAICVCILPSLH